VAEASGGLLSAWDLREVLDDRPGVLVTLVLGSARRPEENELAHAAAAVRELSPDVIGVAVNFRDERAVQVLGPTTRAVWGPSAARDRIGPVYRLATYGSFTQVHRGQAARIERWIASRLGGKVGRVLDLYGGSGALSLALAGSGARVTLVESFRPATECAERAARDQSIEGFTVRSGDAAGVLADLTATGARFDAVITNPPRKGMPPAVRAAIAALEPRLVAYVSCDPETLCRDLDHFSRLGYRTDELLPVDMIPLTDQVETVAFLERSVRPEPVVVYEDDDLFIVERFAHDSPRPAGRAGVHEGDAPVALGPTRSISGLAIGSKASAGDASLRAALGHPRAQFTYLALCRGIVARSGVVQRRTGYRRLARAAGHSVVAVTVRGANTTRIERDLALIGHPVIGDARHGHAPTNRHFEEKYALDRPFLHCIKVEFDHPRTGNRILAGGTVASELTVVLGRLGLVALDVVKQVMVG
jgi:23S rRNA (uracil1939-C5)-methyltransferase